MDTHPIMTFAVFLYSSLKCVYALPELPLKILRDVHPQGPRTSSLIAYTATMEHIHQISVFLSEFKIFHIADYDLYFLKISVIFAKSSFASLKYGSIQ